ncbi:MAG: GWxTD domain-containing protein [Bacteroidales bacterium]|nr:GWxTD domain-containing protein [Bacteroidales bacterium]
MIRTFTKLLPAFLLAFTLIVVGCKVSNQITIVNFSALYQEHEGPDITGIKVFHEADSVSRIFVRYLPSSLRYAIKPGGAYHTAEYSFSYKLFQNYEANVVLDSGTFFLYDSLYYQNKLSLVYNFPFKAVFSQNYVMELRFTDLNTESALIYPIHITKNDQLNAQNFLVVDEMNEVVFEDWLGWKTKFRIISAKKEIDNLFVQYFSGDFPAARPPFSLEHPPVYNLKPKESFNVALNNGTTELLQYGKEGIFYFRTDTLLRSGLAVFRFHDDYPMITDPSLLPLPLRYLTSTEEFRKLTGSDDPKTAVDKFWIETAGNEKRAIELIASYYDRVETANLHFASYKEGWKTDRGMTYIVFGPPKQVFRRTNIETWVYGEAGKRVSLRFDFIENENPYTDNDYELVRLPEFKSPYYIAVDFWRR